MRLHEFVPAKLKIQVSNEEREFVSKHPSTVNIKTLDDRNVWLARNLVRRGVYEISTDNQTLVKKSNVQIIK